MNFDSASWMVALMRVNGQLQSEIDSLKRQLDWREQVTKALSGMAACRKTVTATITGALTAIVFAGGLAAGFAGPAAATECPAGAPIPHGLIGDTWRTVDRHQAAISGIVKDRIGCPIEPEHGVPGLNARLQTFQNGQIAWTPDQGPSMTIWAIRDKAHFRVQWSTNRATGAGTYTVISSGGTVTGRTSGNATSPAPSAAGGTSTSTPRGGTRSSSRGVAAGATTMGGRFPLAAPSRPEISRRPTYPPEGHCRQPSHPQLARPLKVGERGQFLSLQGLGSYPTRLLRRAL